MNSHWRTDSHVISLAIGAATGVAILLTALPAPFSAAPSGLAESFATLTHAIALGLDMGARQISVALGPVLGNNGPTTRQLALGDAGQPGECRVSRRERSA